MGHPESNPLAFDLEGSMSGSTDYRNWAARVARQAARQGDSSEMMRLMSIVKYWEWLADIEDRERDEGASGSKAKTNH
jgi:hypothetical protein